MEATPSFRDDAIIEAVIVANACENEWPDNPPAKEWPPYAVEDRRRAIVIVHTPTLAIATLPLTALRGRRRTPLMISTMPTSSKNNVVLEKV